ncbi:hypothetical protein [Poseidonibacter lekithochrous]|uniref:hypothetical protein n=1 Tax=Poseidonibacter lekithochrous TaxID=1904463 RepID=UPI000D3CCF14|nr:hypothetical protein [Poseidonibacter lekithochrous]
MIKKILLLCSLVLVLNAYEYRAYDVGGNSENSKVSANIKGEVLTLLPFSNLDITPEKISLSGDFILLFVSLNNREIKEPIKLSSDYKNQNIVLKVFQSDKKFDESTLLLESKEIYLDSDFRKINIEY